MTSGGSIVKQGSQELAVGTDDKSDDYIGDAKLIKLGQTEEASGPKVVINRYSFNVNFDSQTDMSKFVKLMVYISEGNSTSIARKDYDFVACEVSQKLKWNKEKALPRDQVKLEIEGGARDGGICGYSVVDKSVELIANPNKVTAPKLQQLKEDLKGDKIISDRLPEKCKKAQSIQNSLKELGLIGLTDLASGAEDCTVTDVTNKTLQRESEDEIAYDYEDSPVPLAGAQFGAPQAIAFSAESAAAPPAAPPQVVRQKVVAEQTLSNSNRVSGRPGPEPLEAPKVELRNYFPETWLFDIVDLNEDGGKVMNLTLPDTITTWVADAVCLSPTEGAVVSASANLLVSQDFFADLVLPYSVKRGEIFPLNVSVFNTVDLKLPVQITVLNSEDFKIGEAVSNVCLPPQDNQVQSFTVKAKELHEVNVTVEAKIVSADSCQSGDANSEGFRDALVKPIIVKPEGFPLEKTQSEFICKQPGEEPTLIALEPLVLPDDDDLVEGSARAWMAVTGDIMAPALANLDKLVTTPYGCGEQNMVSVVPNIYLLEYLQGKGVSVPDIERRAKANIVKGWKRQQKYRHKDGSYSVWGPSDEGAEGSMWLTSFVVKSFGTAAKYFKGSELRSFRSKMEASIKWMTSNVDKETGCAKNVGYTIHSELKGPSLTASVATAILSQEGVEVHGTQEAWKRTAQLYKGIACAMNRTEEDDVYSKALIAYTTFLLDEQIVKSSPPPPPPRPEAVLEPEISEALRLARSLMDELAPKANTTLDGKLFWSTGKGNKARDVELTAYMVLNLVKQNKLSDALMAIKWLTTHRNSRGGFVSTQDTMVALQAISEYSKQIRKDEVALTVEAATESGEEGWSETFDITPTNQLLFTRESVPVAGQTTIPKVKVSGNGCAMVQTILRYNVKRSPYEKVFDLSAETDGETLRVCGSYDGGKEATDMVVIEAELLSGYEADEASLRDLVNNKEVPAPVKKYEYDSKDNVVVLYFNDMPTTQSCWQIKTKKNNQIGELQPANVKIYDYYDPKETYSINYGLTAAEALQE